MLRTSYPVAEAYMLSFMKDAAHAATHIFRVLDYALDIAAHEAGVNIELLSIACLLHDIARAEQFADPKLCHAVRGGEMAYEWLLGQGYDEDFAKKVKHCIATHRYRSNNPPQSLEAKILFDADKLDACGVTGVARALCYIAHAGSADPLNEVLREYEFKLSKLYDRFYTKHGAQLAEKRRKAAQDFYEALKSEVKDTKEYNT